MANHDELQSPGAGNARRRPLIVGLGGTNRPNSSTEKALRVVLAAAEAAGAETLLLGAEALMLPMYAPEVAERGDRATFLVDALRRCDGLVIGSPGYHGGISGLVKNAIDYTEDMRNDERVYLAGRPVGCIVTAAGYQAGVTTLTALRSVVHALRGWPTPLGVVVNTAEPAFAPTGEPLSPALDGQLRTLAAEVVAFARTRLGAA